MKKALMPILLIGLAILLLAGAAWFYEQKWGVEGPFPSQHRHGGSEEEAHDHEP